MSESADQNVTEDKPLEDSLAAGLAAGFGRHQGPPSTRTVGYLPLQLQEAEGEGAPIVKPGSDAMPRRSESGDRYQLAGEIARGGMGAVLRGRDVDLGRDLAIKVLLEKHKNRPEIARRFYEEAQIGGQLQHPGVVPVYDIGRFGDRPFFTMKLVKGKTLAAILGERTDPTADLPRLLNILAPVTQAMAYAHAKGVIHRDLKPANIMIGAFGEVQVMDWGLAKLLAEGGVADEARASRIYQHPDDGTEIRTARSGGTSFGSETEHGSMLGTPSYMPPEQANGDIEHLDRPADVFGLGAILCEILTGKPPYVGQSGEEVRRKARNGDLADAKARLDACGADAELITLAMQCLSPEASARPKNAQVVADTLTAYHNGVQERLRQAELAEAEAKAKAIEEVKRRRMTIALAATVLLAMGLGGGGWLYVKNEHDGRIAQTTRNVNDALSQVALLREKASSAPAGAAVLFAQAREQAQKARALVANTPVDPALRDQVTRLGDELDAEEKDRTLMTSLDAARLKQAELVTLENRFASERAVPLYREAFQAYGMLPGHGEPAIVADRLRQRPAAVREAIVAALDEWDDLTSNPNLAEPEPHRDWLRAVRAIIEPEDAWSRQVRVARAESDPPKRRLAVKELAAAADVTKIPARALTRLGTRGGIGAESDLEPADAVKLLRRAQAHYPSDFWVNQNLGDALMHTREWDDAVRFLTAAAALRPESPGCQVNLGHALKGRGSSQEALACFRKAIELDSNYAGAYASIGSMAEKGPWDDALASCRKAIDLQPKAATFHDSLGYVLRKSGKIDQAIACFQTALELNPKLPNALNNLGEALSEKRQMDKAIDAFQKAIEADPDDYRLYVNLGSCFEETRRTEEAIVTLRKAIALKPNEYAGHFNLGNVYIKSGQTEAAVPCFQKSCETNPKDADSCYSLAMALKAVGKIDDAKASYQKAIELNPKFAEAYCNLGILLKDLGQLDQSLAALQRGHGLGSKRPGWPYPSAFWLRSVQHYVAINKKLPAYLAGEYKPQDMDSRMGLAEVCFLKKRYHSAFELFGEAVDAEPEIFDMAPHFRLEAIQSAVLASDRQGEDAFKLDAKERARLRKQALTWLRADLALHTNLMNGSNKSVRDVAKKNLLHIQKHAYLASIRDTIANLPAAEQESFTQFWSDVAATLKTAGKED